MNSRLARPRRLTGRHAQRGSLLIVALLLSAIIGVSLVSYVRLATTALRTADRSFYANAGVDVAEMGIERAMAAFYQVSGGTSAATAFASPWTYDGAAGTATATFPTASTSWTLGPGAFAQVKVYVKGCDLSGSPYIVARAIITRSTAWTGGTTTGNAIEKWVKVKVQSRSCWADGLVAKDSLTWVGHPTADSWNSTYDTDGTPRASPVAYNSSYQLAGCTLGSANGNISLGSGGNVYGYAATSTGHSTSGGSVHGTGTTTNDPARITSDFSATFPTVTVPTPSYMNTISGALPASLPQGTDTRSTTDNRYYYNFSSSQVISSNLTIADNVTIFMTNHNNLGVVSFHGHDCLTIASTGSLKLYTDGDIDAHGNGIVNDATVASKLQIYGTDTTASGQSITVGGNGQLAAAIYAPNASVTLQGGGSSGHVSGAVVGLTVSMNGGTDFHYDEALSTITSGAGVRVLQWKELQSSSDRDAVSASVNF